MNWFMFNRFEVLIDVIRFVYYFYISALKYDLNSTKQFEKVLSECQEYLKPGHSIWAAIQSNNICDVGGGYHKEWSKIITNSKINLSSKKFSNQELSVNFRNSREIFDTSNCVEIGQDSNYEIQKVLDVPSSGTTMSSCIPSIFHFNWHGNKEKQTDLDGAMGSALTELKTSMSDSEHTDAYAVVYNDSMFTLDQISMAVSKTEQDVKCYPSKCDSNPQKELDEFLGDPIGCLVTSSKLIKGAEAENVLIVQHNGNPQHNLRGTLLRVVSKLFLLNAVDERDNVQLKTAIQNYTHLSCFEKCDDEMWHCKTCETSSYSSPQKYICLPCRIKCHDNTHEFEWIDVRNDKSNQFCQCFHAKK